MGIEHIVGMAGIIVQIKVVLFKLASNQYRYTEVSTDCMGILPCPSKHHFESLEVLKHSKAHIPEGNLRVLKGLELVVC